MTDYFDPNDIEANALVSATFGFEASQPSAEVFVPLSADLPPGYYALIFGSGAFGTSGFGAMPTPNVTGAVNFTGATYFTGRPAFSQWVTGSDLQTRFAVYSKDHFVPAPASAFLMSAGLAGIGYQRRKRHKAA